MTEASLEMEDEDQVRENRRTLSDLALHGAGVESESRNSVWLDLWRVLNGNLTGSLGC